MRFLTEKTIDRLKSQFFDLIETESGVFHYQNVLRAMLNTIQNMLELDEVTLFIFHEWKNEFSIEVSTDEKIVDVSPANFSNEWLCSLQKNDFSPNDG
ncbi:hypothetical protein LAM21_21880, partial [Mycobacterium tuberculosis]|nr:hypothetical protein [Mycobacterium tuberculosis]